ncbi:Uncharacterised protein [Legionella feeleii]|uniref:Uncharacterized protein n=1 Tax=Legionella feeleii TaxID=453 RepID=A0A378KKH5_9GAMM|nr:Uncharacterised protein [Legionella feeleii]
MLLVSLDALSESRETNAQLTFIAVADKILYG